MSEHRVIVDNGKYTFVNHGASNISIERYGDPWIGKVSGPGAVAAMMYALDAARVVIEAARDLEGKTGEALFDARIRLSAALMLHDSLVSDRTLPSAWTKTE